MDLLIDNRLGNGGWLLERVHGLFSGLAGEVEPISRPVDVVEDRDGYRFSVDLRGLTSGSLDVKVEDETLVIDAERNEPTWGKDKEARVHRADRHHGRIHRAFRLPGDVGHTTIKATYKDGVLDVTFAKVPEAKAVKVEVAYSN